MDWDKKLQDLIETGMPQTEIAREVGLTPPSIIDLTSGRQKTVRWEVGTAILALWSKKVGSDRSVMKAAA